MKSILILLLLAIIINTINGRRGRFYRFFGRDRLGSGSQTFLGGARDWDNPYPTEKPTQYKPDIESFGSVQTMSSLSKPIPKSLEGSSNPIKIGLFSGKGTVGIIRPLIRLHKLPLIATVCRGVGGGRGVRGCSMLLIG